MKIRAVLFFVLCFVYIRPAYAVFFDDSNSKWWMARDQWVDNGTDDPNGRISIVDNNNQLQFTAVDNGTGESVDHFYDSKWVVRLDKDFDLSVSYHFGGVSPINPALAGGADIELGVDVPGVDDHVDYYLAPKYKYYTDGSTDSYINARAVSEDIYKRFDMVSDSGVLRLHYDSDADTLSFLAEQHAPNGTVISDFDAMTIDGLRTTKGVSEFYVYFDGASENTTYLGSNVFFENFMTTNANAVVTPEPASVLLFGLGGAAMAIFRKKQLVKRV